MMAIYWIVTFNEVVIFGYDPAFATVSFTVHDVTRLGATNRPEEIEHGPDSLHVFFPFDGVDRSDVNVVREPFFTADFFTVNPGRADVVTELTD